MNIERAITFVTDDPDWIKKILIGGLISLIPIVNFAMIGYVVELMRRVAEDHAEPLPDWGEDFGMYFTDGLKVFVGILIYELPVFVLLGCYLIAMFALGGFDENLNAQSGEGLFVGGMFAFQCLMFIYALLMGIVMPAATIQFAKHGTIGSMLQFGEIFRLIRANLTDYIIMLVVYVGVAYVIAPLGIIACLVGVIFTSWWAYLVFGHLMGQILGKDSAPLLEDGAF